MNKKGQSAGKDTGVGGIVGVSPESLLLRNQKERPMAGHGHVVPGCLWGRVWGSTLETGYWRVG